MPPVDTKEYAAEVEHSIKIDNKDKHVDRERRFSLESSVIFKQEAVIESWVAVEVVVEVEVEAEVEPAVEPAEVEPAEVDADVDAVDALDAVDADEEVTFIIIP